MRDRLIGVVDIITALPTVRRDAMAAIGFCFGGLCMHDLAGHGMHLAAVASFHGLVTPLPEPPTTPISTKIQGVPRGRVPSTSCRRRSASS